MPRRHSRARKAVLPICRVTPTASPFEPAPHRFRRGRRDLPPKRLSPRKDLNASRLCCSPPASSSGAFLCMSCHRPSTASAITACSPAVAARLTSRMRGEPLAVAPAPAPAPETAASAEPEDQRLPCPRWSSRMIIIEVFERRLQLRGPPRAPQRTRMMAS